MHRTNLTRYLPRICSNLQQLAAQTSYNGNGIFAFISKQRISQPLIPRFLNTFNAHTMHCNRVPQSNCAVLVVLNIRTTGRQPYQTKARNIINLAQQCNVVKSL